MYFYTAFYLPQSLELKIPQSFQIEIELIPSENDQLLPAGRVSDYILQKLNLNNSYRNDEIIKYLLITTTDFLPAYNNLLQWRRAQGLEVNYITIEEIDIQFEGRDLQEKIRNCIINYYEETGISYVTLGGNVDYIPDRKVFAFDCEYGSYTDENDIPSDMYYSCLHGDWDANENNVFGEENDETDYFPEVYVARIPVDSITEIEDYISRLIHYESGNIPDYNKAAGFSMELWPNSNSEICQQYIYDKYFPEYYNIQFLYGSENNQDNAYLLMNENQNIIQHTGHAGRQSLALQHGRIRVSELNLLYNNWGGVFYSIGCWAAALDYNSIGENLVSQVDKGFLGFVGNSRYGWGAPAAPGFGFSEFYQKTFFRELFAGSTKLAEANALQKLDFIPYFNGTSVYKWIAYQLNALGDSYFDLNISNPQNMNYTLNFDNDQYQFYISSAGIPLSNVVVSCGDQLAFSNASGQADLEIELLNDPIILYKKGYKTIFIDPEDILPGLYLEYVNIMPQLLVSQGETITIEPVLYNSMQHEIAFEVIYEYNPNEISLDFENNSGIIAEETSLNLSEVDINIKSLADSYQMENGKNILFMQKISSADTGEILTERSIGFTVQAPSITVSAFNYLTDEIVAGDEFQVEFFLHNNGSFSLTGLALELSSTSHFLYFDNPNLQFDIYFDSGAELAFTNQITISENAPSDFTAYLNVNILSSYLEQTYQFSKTVFLSSGKIDFQDDFENSQPWELEPEWQIVDNFSNSGNNSLSCRPQFIGNYTAETPNLTYFPGMELAFYYKYKMPMYGNDGVFIIFESQSISDTLLFLGAGGALPENNSRLPEVYIEGDWAEYVLNFSDIMVHDLEPGTPFSVTLKFNFSEVIENFNEYFIINDIGVFFDDFRIGMEKHEPDAIEDNKLAVFPNPSRRSCLPRFSFYQPVNGSCIMKIFNSKGKLVKEFNYNSLGEGNLTLFWDGKDKWGKGVASGLYFILIDTGPTKYINKFVFLK